MMKKINSRAVLPFCAALLLLYPPLLAQEDDDTEKEPETSLTTEITVTAAFPELSNELILRGSSLREKGKGDLVDSLRGEVGVDAIRRGAINLEPTIRGLQETQVAQFVDGTITLAAGPARMDSGLSHLSPHGTQTVVVVKGPYALTWGAGALSAIDARTYAPGFSSGGLEPGFRLGADWADNEEALDAFAHVYGANERFRYSLLGNLRSGSDYEDGDGNVVPADYDSDDLRWRTSFMLSNNGLIDYSGGYQAQDDLDYAGRLLDATYFRTRSHRLSYLWSGERGVLSTFEGQIYSNHKDHRMNNDEKPTALDMPGRIPPFGLDVDLPTESNSEGAKVASNLVVSSGWRLRVGADYSNVDQTATRFIRRRSNQFLLFEDIVWPDAELENTGVYTQAIRSGEHFEVGATLRADSWDATSGTTSDFFAANTTGEHSNGDDSLSAALSGRFQIHGDWSVSAGVGRVVRTPTTLELYSDRFPSTRFQSTAEFMGNPALDPEVSSELDFGVLGRAGTVDLELDLYYRDIEDYITFTPDPTLPKRLPLSPPLVMRYINGDSAVFRGGELRVGQRVSDRFLWRASASYTWAEDQTFDEPALAIAPLTLFGSLRYTGPSNRLTGELSATYRDDQNRVAVSRFEKATPSSTVVDLRFDYGFDNGLGINAGVFNLADEAYAEHLNSPNPFTGQRVLEIGRSFHVGFRYSR